MGSSDKEMAVKHYYLIGQIVRTIKARFELIQNNLNYKHFNLKNE